MGNKQRHRTKDTLRADYVTGLQQHLRLRVSSEEDAEDIAQEACLKMLQASDSTDIRNPKAYLYQIAHNLLYAHYTNGHGAPLVDKDIESLRSTELSLIEQTVATVRRHQINGVLGELTPKCRTALLLRWRDGLRIKEIAACMDLSDAMVKKYLAKGLQHFRKRLQRFAMADHSAG